MARRHPTNLTPIHEHRVPGSWAMDGDPRLPPLPMSADRKGCIVNCIRILLVDDHELVRRHMCTVLGTDTEMEVVSQAASGYEAIHQAGEHQPDVVLLDLNLPELNGFLAAPMIKKVAPRSEILIVTSHYSLYFVRAAFKAGARGFLSKADICAELVDAVRQVHAKQRFVGRNSRTATDLIVGEATG